MPEMTHNAASVTPAGPPAGQGRLRLLFIHAHPDDESLATGVALATHAARGDEVHVLTATLGQEGEVIPAELAHLEGAEGDPLAPHRREELRRAMAAMGVQHTVLGENGGHTYRDSGMAGSPAASHEAALCAAPLEQVAQDFADHIQALRPDIVVTYDAGGGYGHPDHIRVHQATVAAVRSLPGEQRPALYATVTPRSWARQDRTWLQDVVPGLLTDSAADQAVTIPSDDEPFPVSVVDDARVTHVVINPTGVGAQSKALREHATQVTVRDGWYTLSNNVAARLSGREGFALINPDTGELEPGGETRTQGLQPRQGSRVGGDDLRAVMARYASGVCAVTARADGLDHAMTINSLTSVSLDPPLVLFCVEVESRFHEAIVDTDHWAVSVLAEDQESVARWLSTRGRPLVGQLDRVPHTRGKDGCALVSGALAHLEVRTLDMHRAGDHDIVVGRVTAVDVPSDPGPALVYHRGRFGALA